MADFFTDIKGRLEKRPEPTFEPEYWDHMEQKLNQHQPRVYFRLPFKLFIWGAIGFVFLMLFGIYLSHIRQAQKLTEISNQLMALEIDASSQIEGLRDTTLEEHFPLIISGNNSKFPPEAKAPVNKNQDDHGSEIDPGKAKIFSAQDLDKSSPGKSALLTTESKAHKTDSRRTSKQGTSSLSPLSPIAKISMTLPQKLEINPYHFRQVKASDFFEEKTETGARKIYFQGIEAGINTGGLILMADSLNEALGLTIGLETAVRLTKHLRIWGQLSMMSMSYETEREVPALGIPIWKSPAPTYSLAKVEVERTGLFYSGGIEFIHTLQPKLEGFFGLGYGGGTWLPYGVRYEFDDDETEDYEGESETVYIDKIPFRGGLWQAHAGLSYRLNKQLQWTLQANYRMQAPRRANSFPGILNLRSGLSFRFSY